MFAVVMVCLMVGDLCGIVCCAARGREVKLKLNFEEISRFEKRVIDTHRINGSSGTPIRALQSPPSPTPSAVTTRDCYSSANASPEFVRAAGI